MSADHAMRCAAQTHSLVETLRPFPGHCHLDVAGGTGDVAFRILRAIRQAEAEARLQPGSKAGPAAGAAANAGASSSAMGSVVVCDINPSMLEEGKKKAQAASDIRGGITIDK